MLQPQLATFFLFPKIVPRPCRDVVDVMSHSVPSHTTTTKREGKNVNIPALVLNPGNDGIAGIAFSIPE
jgi:hypothetical protein